MILGDSPRAVQPRGGVAVPRAACWAQEVPRHEPPEERHAKPRELRVPRLEPSVPVVSPCDTMICCL